MFVYLFSCRFKIIHTLRFLTVPILTICHFVLTCFLYYAKHKFVIFFVYIVLFTLMVHISYDIVLFCVGGMCWLNLIYRVSCDNWNVYMNWRSLKLLFSAYFCCYHLIWSLLKKQKLGEADFILPILQTRKLIWLRCSVTCPSSHS